MSVSAVVAEVEAGAGTGAGMETGADMRAEWKTGPVAPWWHTVLVIAGLAGMSVASRLQDGLPSAHVPGMSSRASGYLTVIVVEWLIVLLIWIGLRSRGLSMRSLISGRWETAKAFFRDLGIAAGFVVVAVALLSVVPALLGVKPSSGLANMTPKTGFELAIFLLLATTAGGFCEEIIFRGYLMRQFCGWTGSWVAAVALQGMIFGLSHGYYSKIFMGIIMLHGILLGVLVYWRKSLLPGMLAHGLQDTLGGIIAFLS